MNYKKVCFIAGLIGLSACTPPEITEMRRLCALDAGQKVYETVQADGYFDATEDGALVVNALVAGAGSKFSYIEFCNDKTSSASSPGLKVDQGCWRAKKVARDSASCNADADKQMQRKMMQPFPEFMKTQCISVEKIEKEEAQYRLEIEIKSWESENSVVKYTRYETRVTDTKTDKAIGVNIDYGAIKEPDISYGCHSPQVTGLDKNTSDKEIILLRSIKPIDK